MRNWMLCACITLALPCLGFAQQPLAAGKTPAGAPSSNSAPRSALADLSKRKCEPRGLRSRKRTKPPTQNF